MCSMRLYILMVTDLIIEIEQRMSKHLDNRQLQL